MTFPSTEFSDVVAKTCQGSAQDSEVEQLHAALLSDRAAMDEYLWEVEVHSRLIQMAAAPATREAFVTKGSNHRLRRFLLTNIPYKWASAAAALWLIMAGGTLWIIQDSYQHQKRIDSDNSRVITARRWDRSTSANPNARIKMNDNTAATTGAGQLEGIYRETVRFAMASDAPVIVGTGGTEPIALGSEVPYSQGGNTLHIWDWSKSTMSRVMKDIRLWPTDVFAVSPDGKSLVLASGKVVDLTTGEPSQIDLGGEYYFDSLGGSLQRIVQLQFTPDGRHVALRLSNVALTQSSQPLRKQDFSTTETIQIITYPAGKLVCEFPAGLGLAFSADSGRAVTGIPHYKSKQQIIEYSAKTGEVLRRYEPRLQEFAMVMALSPDGSRLAAFDSGGEPLSGNLMIWDSSTGELNHKVHLEESSPMDLRFSPDGKLVAISLIKRTIVIDVSSGAIVGAAAQDNPGHIRWSPDSHGFDLICNVTSVALSDRQDNAGQTILYNLFPSLKHWNIEDVRKK